jgi:hypothetical protein
VCTIALKALCGAFVVCAIVMGAWWEIKAEASYLRRGLSRVACADSCLLNVENIHLEAKKTSVVLGNSEEIVIFNVTIDVSKSISALY